MPSVLSSSAPPLPVAQCLDAALGLFRAALLTCLPYGVLTVLSSQLPQIYRHLSVAAPLQSPVWWLANIAGGVLGATFLNATLLRLAAVAGARASRGPLVPDTAKELRTALARVPAFMGLIVLFAAAGAVLAAPALLVPRDGRVWVLGVAGLGLTYLAVMLSCAWVDLVLNGRSLLQSIAHSISLVHGNALRVLAAGAVGLLMLMVLAVVASVVIALVVPLVGGDDLALITSITADVMVACIAVAVPFLAALLFTVSTYLHALHPSPAASGGARAAE